MSVESGEKGEEVRITLTARDTAVRRRSPWRALLRWSRGAWAWCRTLHWPRRRRALWRSVAVPARVQHACDEVRAGLPTAALLLAASALLSEWGPLDFLDGAVIRKIAQMRVVREGALTEDALVLQQLEVAAPARVAQLEMKESARTEIERLGGVAPIDRGRMAELLIQLAQRLQSRPVAEPKPIVAIDVDLAPLGGGATPSSDVTKMHEALTALRRSAHVIAIVLSRDGVESRRLRNDFMVRSECTRYGAGTSPSDTGRGQLHYASPRLFHPVGGYPISFPHELGEKDDEIRSPAFPSVGTLIHHLHHLEQRAGPEPSWFERWVAAPVRSSVERMRERWTGRNERAQKERTLTFYCEQAHAGAGPGSAALLIEDALSEPSASPRPGPGVTAYEQWVSPYRTRQFNWRLLDTPRLRYTIVESIAAMATGSDESLSADNFDSKVKVLVLSIDGGARHDKFDIAGVSPEPVGGAALHSLQALSLDEPFEESAWRNLMIDVGVGVGFALFLALLGPPLAGLQASMPTFGSWLTIATPLLAAGLWMWLSMRLAACAMDADIWINPVYLIAGIALDAYLKGWERPQPAPSAVPTAAVIPQGERWRFGVDTALALLREGYGARRAWLIVQASTEAARITVSKSVRHSRSGALVADEVLCAALRIAVLVTGFWLIGEKLWKGVTS